MCYILKSDWPAALNFLFKQVSRGVFKISQQDFMTESSLVASTVGLNGCVYDFGMTQCASSLLSYLLRLSGCCRPRPDVWTPLAFPREFPSSPSFFRASLLSSSSSALLSPACALAARPFVRLATTGARVTKSAQLATPTKPSNGNAEILWMCR